MKIRQTALSMRARILPLGTLNLVVAVNLALISPATAQTPSPTQPPAAEQSAKAHDASSTNATADRARIDAARHELDAAIKDATTNDSDKAAGSDQSLWSPSLVCKLSLGIAVFAIIAFALVAALIWKEGNPEQILRTFAILVIIFAAVFLVVAGYSSTQITPVIGLLGTIAGYLLGRRIEPTPDSRDAGDPQGANTPKPNAKQ